MGGVGIVRAALAAAAPRLAAALTAAAAASASASATAERRLCFIVCIGPPNIFAEII